MDIDPQSVFAKIDTDELIKVALDLGNIDSPTGEAFVRDYYVVIVNNGTAAYVQADHDMTLKNIDRFFGEIASSEDLTALWPASNTKGRK